MATETCKKYAWFNELQRHALNLFIVRQKFNQKAV